MERRKFYEKYGEAKPRAIIERPLDIIFEFDLTGTAGQTYEKTYTVSAGYDFLWEQTTVYLGIPATGSQRNVKFSVRDQFVTEDFMTIPVWTFAAAGSGERPYTLPRPYAFRGGTTIIVTVVDSVGGAAVSDLQIVLKGYRAKIY
jgi:hypothetical protein